MKMRDRPTESAFSPGGVLETGKDAALALTLPILVLAMGIYRTVPLAALCDPLMRLPMINPNAPKGVNDRIGEVAHDLAQPRDQHHAYQALIATRLDRHFEMLRRRNTWAPENTSLRDAFVSICGKHRKSAQIDALWRWSVVDLAFGP